MFNVCITYGSRKDRVPLSSLCHHPLFYDTVGAPNDQAYWCGMKQAKNEISGSGREYCWGMANLYAFITPQVWPSSSLALTYLLFLPALWILSETGGVFGQETASDPQWKGSGTKCRGTWSFYRWFCPNQVPLPIYRSRMNKHPGRRIQATYLQSTSQCRGSLNERW